MGVDQKPEVQAGKIHPLEAHGVKLMSLGLIVERDAPAIWRGPIIMKVIGQFLRDVEWGQLDYFLVNLPPGCSSASACRVIGIVENMSYFECPHLRRAHRNLPRGRRTADRRRRAELARRSGARRDRAARRGAARRRTRIRTPDSHPLRAAPRCALILLQSASPRAE